LLGTGGTFVDAFCGSGRVAYAAPQESLILGDFNGDAIAFHRACRDRLAGFTADLEVLFVESNNTKERYNELKAELNVTGAGDRRVALWYFMNVHGFNGLMRQNRKGEFNVAYGAPKNPRTRLEFLPGWSKRLQGAEIFYGDFEQTARKAQAWDVVYMDPPYVPDSVTNSAISYTAEGFDSSDQKRVASVARELADSGVTVLVSNSGAAQRLGLYDEADEIVVTKAHRSVSAVSAVRGDATEIIAIYRPR
jgi:DNA adenine methylase